MGLHEDVGEILFTADQIDEIVKRIGDQVSRDYADKDLAAISVLKGRLSLWPT